MRAVFGNFLQIFNAFSGVFSAALTVSKVVMMLNFLVLLINYYFYRFVDTKIGTKSNTCQVFSENRC